MTHHPFATIGLVALLALGASPTAIAETWIGSGISRVGNRITVAPSPEGPLLRSVLHQIDDASADNVYTVVLAPGEYQLGFGPLELKPFVHLRGSGRDLTILRRGGSGTLNGSAATVLAPAHSSMSDLYVQNEGGGEFGNVDYAVGIWVSGGPVKLERLRVYAGGASIAAFGIRVEGSFPTLELDSSWVTSSQYGIWLARQTSAVIRRSRIHAASFGITLDNAYARLTYSELWNHYMGGTSTLKCFHLRDLDSTYTTGCP